MKLDSQLHDEQFKSGRVGRHISIYKSIWKHKWRHFSVIYWDFEELRSKVPIWLLILVNIHRYFFIIIKLVVLYRNVIYYTGHPEIWKALSHIVITSSSMLRFKLYIFILNSVFNIYFNN